MPAIWAAIIGAGATAYGAHQQNKAGGKIGRQQDRLYGIQADTAEALKPYALDFYRSAADAYNPAAAYYKAVAGGDRSRLLATLSPQLSQIGQQYGSLLNASRALNPRGGGSANFNQELIYRAGDEQQALINAERSGSYGNLAKMAGLAADIGSGAAGHATNAAAGASGMLNNAWLMQMMQSGNQAQAYGELGKALIGMVGYKPGQGWYVGSKPGEG